MTTACGKTDRMAEYALRSLPASEHTALEAHVGECAACREELAAIGPAVDALADWPTDILRPSAPLWGRLAERIGADPALEARWAEEPDWNDVAPGIACKLLSTDETSDRITMLVRLAPDASYPAHTHAGIEELHLLDGELWIDERQLSPGDYSRAEPGTGDHRVWSETGCTCVLVTSRRDVLH